MQREKLPDKLFDTQRLLGDCNLIMAGYSHSLTH